MLLRLLLLMTVLPLLDFFLLYHFIDGFTSLAIAVGLILFTGILGAFLARAQGIQALRRFLLQSGQSAPPADALLDGVLILLAATVLITPGLITDMFGLALLVPPIRGLVRRWVMAWLKRRIRIQAATSPHFKDKSAEATPPVDATVIDVEYERRD